MADVEEGFVVLILKISPYWEVSRKRIKKGTTEVSYHVAYSKKRN